MHRIDTPTAQIDKFGQGKNGFTNGDPSTGRLATYLNSDMWDAVQEEIANVIENAGIPLDKTKHNQLYLAIQKAITDKGYLLKANNLIDLANKYDARFNLDVYSKGESNSRYLSIAGGTLTGQLSINNADFINKNGHTTYTDGGGNLHRQAGGLRLTIADTILTELYYNETVGNSAEVSLHNKYGSTDSYISLRNDGQLSVIGVSPQVILSNGTIFATDGNVKGSVWDNGYLSNWILSKANAAKDAAIDWANTNCARKPTAWLQPTGWIRDATTGYITQWGIVTRGGGTTRVWFPNAFPKACVNVKLTLRNSNSGGSSFNVFANGENEQGFDYVSGDNEVQAFWEATGY
jgi:hypothetical protein